MDLRQPNNVDLSFKTLIGPPCVRSFCYTFKSIFISVVAVTKSIRIKCLLIKRTRTFLARLFNNLLFLLGD